MSLVLVDTSIWIDFFRGNAVAGPLRDLIESNQIVTNDLILAELLPSVQFRKEEKLVGLLKAIQRTTLTIDWNEITTMQVSSLKAGFNHVGIPDLIIAQNSLRNDLVLFENDKHFGPMRELFGVKLYRTGWA